MAYGRRSPLHSNRATTSRKHLFRERKHRQTVSIASDHPLDRVQIGGYDPKDDPRGPQFAERGCG